VLAAVAAGDLEQRLPGHLPTEAIGAQHGLQRDALSSPAAADVAGVAQGGAAVARGGADEGPHAALEVGAGRRPHLHLAVTEQVAVGGFGADQQVDHAVGHRVDLIEEPRGELGKPGRDLRSEWLHSITSS
jgi:hypothetical protein